MRYRLLGRTGLRVSELFFGAMSFYERGGPDALREYRAMLDAYADAGGNVIDTASAYGESEDVVGELLAGRRDRFVVATKYTLSRDRTDPNAAGNHRKNLVLSLEDSLRRLRTDYIDLYWVHIWDRHTPVEETMRALDDAVRAGKILYVGMSDAPAWLVSRANTLAEWRDWTPFAGMQVPYNLLRRDAERELLPMAEAFGMSVAVWGALAGGVLSGKFTGPGGIPKESTETGATRVDPASLTSRDHAVAHAVQEVARELGASAAQVAIAWTRTRSAAVHPIVGARDLAQLADDLGAADVVLPGEAVRRLEAAAEFEVGFPGDFITEYESHAQALGGAAAGERDGRRAAAR
ncbi:aldo/keto reductase [Planomonospora parontospora]|uniref:aldo/keto reductase n=1 Tax=Planomonospora parontospora TaxID=58119 RepID=UPI001670BF5E|nr:aldo/keto reductase [Planomonospora parontospora]GGL37264.1 oxidoreductase [Planomonospora parontospora subsp. antibiotica]GII17604.1 oxidoreductase [Planomonospora parontospora subsp. antibiotica]